MASSATPGKAVCRLEMLVRLSGVDGLVQPHTSDAGKQGSCATTADVARRWVGGLPRAELCRDTKVYRPRRLQSRASTVAQVHKNRSRTRQRPRNQYSVDRAAGLQNGFEQN